MYPNTAAFAAAAGLSFLPGRAPFGGDRISAVLEQITTADPPPVPNMPPPIQVVLRRALAKDPLGRYPSAGALASAFREALGADTMPAAAGSAPQEPPTLLRRVLSALVALLRR